MVVSEAESGADRSVGGLEEYCVVKAASESANYEMGLSLVTTPRAAAFPTFSTNARPVGDDVRRRPPTPRKKRNPQMSQLFSDPGLFLPQIPISKNHTNHTSPPHHTNNTYWGSKGLRTPSPGFCITWV